MSTPTPNETSDNAWARDKVNEWVSNVEGTYHDTQLLARLSPPALGIYVVGTLYGDGARDFTRREVADARRAIAGNAHADLLLSVAMEAERGDIPRRAVNTTRGYVADSLARRDVQGIDWEELALDLLDTDRDQDDAPQWARETADAPQDEEPEGEVIAGEAVRERPAPQD